MRDFSSDPGYEALKRECKRIGERYAGDNAEKAAPHIVDEMIEAAGRHGFNHTPQIIPTGRLGSVRIIMVDGRHAPSFLV